MINSSLIVIQYGDPDLLLALFRSLEEHQDENLFSEAIIVNNGEALPRKIKERIEQTAQSIDKRFIVNPDDSYSSGVNLGVSESDEEQFIISNNDIKWKENSSIRPLFDTIKSGKAAIVSPQLLNPDGSFQHTYSPFHSISTEVGELVFYRGLKDRLSPSKSDEIQVIDGFAVGAFLAIDKSVFEELDGFDEAFSFYGEDVDFCYRAKKSGYEIAVHSGSEIVHTGGASSAGEFDAEYNKIMYNSRMQFIKKQFSHRYALVFGYLKMVSLAESYILFKIFQLATGKSRWKRRAERRRKSLINMYKLENRPKLLTQKRSG